MLMGKQTGFSSGQVNYCYNMSNGYEVYVNIVIKDHWHLMKSENLHEISTYKFSYFLVGSQYLELNFRAKSEQAKLGDRDTWYTDWVDRCR